MWKPDPATIITAEMKAAEALNASWCALRSERDRRLDATDKLMRRHADQVEMNATTTLSAGEYSELLTYRQALRDLPELTPDPLNPDWPVYPIEE